MRISNNDIPSCIRFCNSMIEKCELIYNKEYYTEAKSILENNNLKQG